MTLKKLKTALLAGATTVALVAVAVPGSSASVKHAQAASVNWATVTHLTKSGPTSMAALVAAAEKEGHLNVITLPTNWANYGAIMTTFSKLYHISINSENPEGSSQDELNAIQADAGRSDDPDVLDVGQSFGIEAANARRTGSLQGPDAGTRSRRRRRPPAATGTPTTAATSPSAATPRP